MEYLNKTLEEYAKESNSWLWGKIFILKSPKFGVHIFLCTKYPAKSYGDRTKFINLGYETADTYFYSSVCNDVILDMYEGIKSYDFAMKRYLMFKEEAKKELSIRLRMEQWKIRKRFEFVRKMLDALYSSQDVTNREEDSLYLEYELEEKKLMKSLNL